jgi:hypothetical protein
MQRSETNVKRSTRYFRYLILGLPVAARVWYDPCIPKWLNQASAKDDFVRLEDVGIHGNMHEMFLDKNSVEVIKFINGWVGKNMK